MRTLFSEDDLTKQVSKAFIKSPILERKVTLYEAMLQAMEIEGRLKDHEKMAFNDLKNRGKK